MKRRALIAAGLSIFLVSGTSLAAGPDSKGAGGSSRTRFAGSCSVKGTVTFDPPATVVSQELTYQYRSKGSCSGTLNGRKLADVPVRLRQRGPSEGSCASAQTTSPGKGKVSFPNGKTLRYRVEFVSVGTEIDFTFRGSRSGNASGHGTFETDRTPPDTAAKCATGLRRVPMDMTLETETPLVSGRG